MIIKLILYVSLVVLNLNLIYYIFIKKYDRYASSICVYFLFIPICAFQSFPTYGASTFAAFILSAFPSMIFLVLTFKRTNNDNKKKMRLLLVLSILIGVLGTYDFSIYFSNKERKANNEIELISRSITRWVFRKDLSKMKWKTATSDVKRYLKNINKRDPWGNPYIIHHILYRDNNFITIQLQIHSNGPDGLPNTNDDLGGTSSQSVGVEKCQLPVDDKD